MSVCVCVCVCMFVCARAREYTCTPDCFLCGVFVWQKYVFVMLIVALYKSITHMCEIQRAKCGGVPGEDFATSRRTPSSVMMVACIANIQYHQ